MLLLKCAENGSKNCYVLKLSVISIYLFIAIVLPNIAYSYSAYGVSLNFFRYDIFVSLLLAVVVSL